MRAAESTNHSSNANVGSGLRHSSVSNVSSQTRCYCSAHFTVAFSGHQQSHTGERPYVCGIPGCGQRFYNSSDCKRHEKSKKRHTNLQH
ncbi:hypothetical protein SCLCIDRAFT_130975 [Scleroderma citrinum Foug A]|uniref:C2H2-type domain-containing protein n=1 Tax=Scleroderma citrinum Foug A TaxID=1036808 RepID=A0A0C2ZXL5_9AGAM|nr:hypothetical protein SCLCIDRAFT_130975 [Scleroderma citrinum Foug A]